MDWGGAPAQKLLKYVMGVVNRNTVDLRKGKGPQSQWIVEAWANVNERGSANMRHVHGGCYWSAVYYVRIDEGEGGQLILHDPRMPTLAMHAPYLRFNKTGGEREVRIKPQVGRLVIFPSWLGHEVEPWQGDGVRISIALNIIAARVQADPSALKDLG
jgi:uncharacterized protein (TIGR02466 family)